MAAEQPPMTEATYYILLALQTPGHGYGMMRQIRELSGGRIVMGPGTLYGVLTRMRKEGMIHLEAEEERRKTYVITETGKDALYREYERLKRLMQDGKVLEDEKVLENRKVLEDRKILEDGKAPEDGRILGAYAKLLAD